MAIHHIVIQVRLEDGVWVKDERFGGWGCDPGNNWQPVYRVRIRAPQGEAMASDSCTAPLRVTSCHYRDGMDPSRLSPSRAQTAGRLQPMG